MSVHKHDYKYLRSEMMGTWIQVYYKCACGAKTYREEIFNVDFD